VISQVERLLLDEEADYLIKKAGEVGLNRSKTSEGIADIRTSRTAFLPMNDRVVECVGKRLATIAGMPEKSLEPLQVTDYTHKQRYDAHYDDLGVGPKRLKTLFAYLKDEGLSEGRCGGATVFHQLRRDGQHLRVYPSKGNAVMWSNFTPEGRHNDRTLHAGEPVTCPGAHKIGLNAWFLDSPGRRRKSRRSSRRKISKKRIKKRSAHS
jgi:hypothetical protein